MIYNIRWIMSEDGKFLSGQGKFNVYLHIIGYRYKSSCFCGNTGPRFVAERTLIENQCCVQGSTLNEITVHQSINPDKLTPIYQTVVKILWLKSLIINIKFWNKEFNRFKIIFVQSYCGLRSKIGHEIDEDRLVWSSCNHDSSWRTNPIFDDFQIVHYT
ncbi:hypothetical protein DERF_010793 [Dermatophagoides farinae]|uniref:Uncharacterized protein n=1 Tax=Dermatophagoides farinae TaxID=6954 RepID=A0A922HR04_DERFA|nr:hypothetical protein DERF_010793 [Dermatophagoides farinae]